MAKGLSKAECAQILTALCRKRLVESGYPVAAFGISETEVSNALEQRTGLSVETPVPVMAPLEPQVHEVWIGWLHLSKQAVSDIDIKSKSKIEERLAFGFTPTELLRACEVALADPALVKRTRLRSISKPLENDRRVCSLIGRVYVRPVKATWLTPFEELWRRHYPDGEVPFGVLAKSLSGLVAKHGAERVLEEAEQYLDATSLAYISWPKFAQGFGTWSYGTKLPGSRSSYARDAVSGL